MAIVVNGHAANVHAHVFRVDGGKGFFLAGKGVVDGGHGVLLKVYESMIFCILIRSLRSSIRCGRLVLCNIAWQFGHTGRKSFSGFV